MSTHSTAPGGRVNAQIGRRIQAHMASGGMTQGQLAAALGLTQASVSRKLSGERPWFANELVNVSAVLDVRVGDLFGESGQDGAAPGLASSRQLVGAAA